MPWIRKINVYDADTVDNHMLSNDHVLMSQESMLAGGAELQEYADRLRGLTGNLYMTVSYSYVEK